MADGLIPSTVKLTRTVQIELAFPLDGLTWQEVGAGHGRLGVLRAVMHRLLNAGITGLMANKHLPEDARPNALAYIKREIDEIEQWACDKGVEHMQSLALPGTITDRLQRVVKDMVKRYWKDKGKNRIPSFKHGAPIMVRDGGWTLTLDEQGRFTFAVKLFEGRTGKTRFAVRATKDWHYSLLKRIASDPSVKCGDCKIVRDERGNKKKWYAKLSFTSYEPVSTMAEPGVVMAVNRGRHNFLYATCTKPGKFRVLWPGEDVLAAKKKFEAIKRERRRHARVSGKGARGHGVHRRYREYEHGDDGEALFVRTTCQRAAAEVVKWARSWGAGTVVIEDFTTIESEDKRYVPSWPWYQLKQSVKWACKKAGLTLIETPSQYISVKCPRCGNIDPRQHNLTTGTFHCARCPRFSRDADLIATLNMLDAEADIGAWRKGLDEGQRMAELAWEGEIPDASDDEVALSKAGKTKTKKGGSRKAAAKGAKPKRSGGKGRKGSKKRDE